MSYYRVITWWQVGWGRVDFLVAISLVARCPVTLTVIVIVRERDRRKGQLVRTEFDAKFKTFPDGLKVMKQAPDR